MPVLNTTSPAAETGAPKAWPENVEPSSSTNFAPVILKKMQHERSLINIAVQQYVCTKKCNYSIILTKLLIVWGFLSSRKRAV